MSSANETFKNNFFLPFSREKLFNKVVIRCFYIQIFPGFGKNFAKNLSQDFIFFVLFQVPNLR